jgi:hypothetical protein
LDGDKIGGSGDTDLVGNSEDAEVVVDDVARNWASLEGGSLMMNLRGPGEGVGVTIELSGVTSILELVALLADEPLDSGLVGEEGLVGSGVTAVEGAEEVDGVMELLETILGNIVLAGVAGVPGGKPTLL